VRAGSQLLGVVGVSLAPSSRSSPGPPARPDVSGSSPSSAGGRAPGRYGASSTR